MVMESKPQPGNGHEPHNTTSQQHRHQCDDQTLSSADEAELLWNLRKYLILLATLSATITYEAGLAQPGGLWPDNQQGYLPDEVIMFLSHTKRYKVFFYCNTTAFMTSLIVLILLLVRELSQNAIWLRSLCHRGLRGYTLRACVLLDLISVMGAFAAGSCRIVSASVYVILISAVVFACIMIQVLLLKFAKDLVIDFFDWMFHITAFKRPNSPKNCDRSIKGNKKSSQKWRKYLMLIGASAMSFTYQAGLLPPGALWPADRDGHFTCDLAIYDTYPMRYKVFFYGNATAFVASMVIVILLLNTTMSKYKRYVLAMKTAMVMGMLGLLGAYAAGCCRT